MSAAELGEAHPVRNRVFAAPADDPRARRPVDAATLAVSVVVVCLLGGLYRGRGDVDTRVLDLFAGQLPGWLSGVATIAFIFGGLYVVGLMVGILVLGHGRSAVARDMLLAAALGFVAAVAAAYLFGPEFPDVLPEIAERDGFPSFPVVRLAVAVAAIRVAGPYLAVPMRRVGHRLVVAMSLAALVLSYGTVSAVIGGLAMGVAASSAIHLIFGSGLGIPGRARIIAALAEMHLAVVDVEYLQRRNARATVVRAQLADGADVLVKVFGRDVADAAFASRVWRSIWYRDGRRTLAASSQQLAEHESLVLLVCERDGVSAHRLVGWSRASTGDTLIVARWLGGTLMSDTTGDDLDDATLDRVWRAASDLHAAGIAHGDIDANRIVIGENAVVFVDFETATVLADDVDRRRDRAQTLVATSAAVGDERALAAARRIVGDALVLDALPLVQAAVLGRGLQQDAKAAKLKLGRVRSDAADALGVKAPELEQLQRVSWGSVAMAALTLFAAYSLISALTDIGLDTIVEEMSNATWSWVVVALVFAQLTNVGEYFSLSGVVGFPIPFGPTIMFRYALSFISLAVPADAGAIAMNIRYQQKLGVPVAAAVAQGPLLTLFSKGFDVILLLVSAKFIGEALDTESLDLAKIVRLVGLIVVAAVVACVVVAAVPRLRAKTLPHLTAGFSAVKGSLTDPERLMKIVGGTLTQKILFALTLAASVAAFGESLSFGKRSSSTARCRCSSASFRCRVASAWPRPR